MRIIMLVFGLLLIGSAQVGLPTEALAQVGSSISTDGSPPNDNAMLDVKSPMSGAGKGILIPRISENQRTNANGSVEGGLLDDSGNLRGGAAQGLMVYQTNGSEGLYFNTSQIATPTWVYLGTSTTNYLPLTGGTMSGTLNMGAQIVTNVAHIDFNGEGVSVGRGANGADSGAAVGFAAIGTNSGAALGALANGYDNGAAMGLSANGSTYGAAVGREANGYSFGVAMGYSANGYNSGAAVGREAIGTNSGAAMGYLANGFYYGAAVGRSADGSLQGAAMGYLANGADYGAAVGRSANGYSYGAAMGEQANGTNYGAAMGNYARGYKSGAAVGYYAYGYNSGVAMGYQAKGFDNGAAVGREANGINYGVAVGTLANGRQTNVAIGARANAQGGTQRIAIGNDVTNTVDGSVRIRGHLYLDGGTNILTNSTFGSSDWGIKAFTIDHPLDPQNKILRHFCLEGPQVWNVYAGNAQLVNGQAVIELPDYYSALNLVGSEIYSLTVVDESADEFPLVKVVKKVADNGFVIAGTQDVKVSWTIKVLRNDPGCIEDLKRRPVEQWKNEIGN